MNKTFLLLSLAYASTLFSDATPSTTDLNRQLLEELPFDDSQDFGDAACGFIAPLPNQGIIKNADGQIIWDLSAFQFGKQATDTVNPSLFRQAKLLQYAGLFKVTSGIYQVRGADISNMTIIEGKTGIILIDPLLSKETAKAALDLYFQNRPKKPIKAVIYTHSHADHFGGVKGVITQQDVDQKKVKVIAPAGFTQAALEENVMAGNAMGRRALYMYGSLLTPSQEGQMTAGLGLTLSRGEITLILPTELVNKTGEEKIIDGVKFVFLMAPGSEAPAEMLFFLPEFKALCAAEDATHTMHNLYSLRGAKVRDGKAWANYLNQAIEMFGQQTEIVFAQHHWPRWGHDRVIDYLEKQRDLYKYIHDQSLRLANQGYTMVEIGEIIELPRSLALEWYNRGYYGSLNHNAKSVYNFYLGWFNGNPSTLHQLPEVEGSKKYVEYMGGADAIMEKARQDFASGNYRWVAQALNHIVFADPSNKKARNFLAATLDQLGYQAEDATWRNFYLTGSKELRQGVQPELVSSTDNPDIISMMPLENIWDYFAIRLDGMRAANNPMMLNFNFPEQKYLIQIKNGVMNYYCGKNDPQGDLTITLSRADFNRIMLKQAKPQELIKSKKLTIEGDPKNLQKFLTLFDSFNPWFNIVEP